MKKRMFSAVMWLYVGWYAGNLLSALFGIPAVIGWIPAVFMACVVVEIPARLATVSFNLRRTAGPDSI